MRNKKTELLSPAGSYESFRAGLNAGADAFYLGAQRFGARAYAKNFTDEMLMRVIDEAHIFGRKIYLTVNTLLKEAEINELYDFIRPLYEHGLDAVIVQDMGSFSVIKENFPDLPIHASTQMTITGYEGAAFLEKCGASRVIPARELSLEEIRQINKNTGLEIECFVHGALCYCYSGACLMSSFIGGRSGNRGKCAQPCRMPYRVSIDGRSIDTKKELYPLNTKDICLIEDIASLIEAGITSFKIEGRMKRPEYTAGVVSVYRKYIDMIEEGRKVIVSKDDKNLLADLFNRDGFSKSYFFGGGSPGMMALNNEKLSGERARKADAAYAYVRKSIIEQPVKKALSADFIISADYNAYLTVTDGAFYATAAADASRALKRPINREFVLKQLNKTGDTDFYFNNTDTAIDCDAFMTTKQLNDLRREALKIFTDEITAAYRRGSPLDKAIEKISEKADEEPKCPQLTVSVEKKEQIAAMRDEEAVSIIYVPLKLYDELKPFEKEKYQDKISPALPYVSRYPKNVSFRELILRAAEDKMNFLVRNLEDAAFLISKGYADRLTADYTIYTMNEASADFWGKQGLRKNTAPLELNRHELKARKNSKSELIIYGKIPLMLSAQCI